MPRKFSSVRSVAFGLFLLSACLLIIFLAIILPWFTGNVHTITELIIRILFALILPFYSLWIWLGTSYITDGEMLTARSGPMVFKIPIRNITAIRLNQKTIGALWKPTTSWNSIQIEYDKSDSVFISPSDQEGFIAELLTINRDIEIKQNW